MNKKIIFIFLVLFLIFFEFLRDFIFININLQIQYLFQITNGHDSFNYTDSRIFSLINNFSLNNLQLLKWVMSVVFFLLFLIIGSLLSYILWHKKETIKFIKIYAFGGFLILLASLFVFLLGKLLNIENQNNFYYISIELSHFVQSSLYPISFLLIFYYNTKTKFGAKY